VHISDEPPAPDTTRLHGFDGISQAEAEVVEVQSLEEAADCLAEAGRTGRTVALRASGASFHDQSLGGDLVLQLGGLSGAVALDGDIATVGPAATCGDIFDTLIEHQQLLPQLPTSRRISLGGALAADTLTRWSPFAGKLSSSLESFELYCPDGSQRTVTRPGSETSGLNDRLFRAVPGGFGLLGLIGESRFTPTRTGQSDGGAPRVATQMAPTRDLAEVVDLTIGQWLDCTPAPTSPAPTSLLGAQAPWAVVDPDGVGAVYLSELVPHDAEGDALLIHQRDGFSARMTHLTTISSMWNRIGWTLIHNTIASYARSFVDPLDAFSFMMDANWSARDLARSVGIKPWLIQQSYAVPLQRSADSPGRPLAAFLQALQRLAKDLAVTTDLIDLLYLREDDGLMSAARGGEAVVVSVAFQGVGRGHIGRIEQLCRQLSEVAALLDGRVHLTKHVYVEPDVLQQMYGESLIELGELRRQVDPRRTLRSALYDRVLGPAWGDG
jgi:FAD/FMN-containing dehydrogenase